MRYKENNRTEEEQITSGTLWEEREVEQNIIIKDKQEEIQSNYRSARSSRFMPNVPYCVVLQPSICLHLPSLLKLLTLISPALDERKP